MRWFGLLLALLTFSITAPAAAKIRAVFIGIDKYAFSQTQVPFADFKDLHGAVNDARAIKRTLASVYGLDFDADGSDCASENAQSITLINQCATRKAIFAAWNRQIAASSPGDTLILYFAGHGSRFIDDQEFRQASGYNGTILPHDARNPKPAPGAAEAEIRDVEIKEVIDDATAKGVNVVTIFDSCNSGTITRDGPADGQSRWAPASISRGARSVAAPSPGAATGPGGGYRVHFAAAGDGEEAREVGAIGQRSGVFTTIFADTIRKMPDATFADIATEVRLRLAASGHAGQNPQAEGALSAAMGKSEWRVSAFDVGSGDEQAWLEGGALLGITKGSEYKLYESTSAARDGQAPLAEAVVAEVQPTRAMLDFGGKPVPRLSAKAVAVETRRAWGEQTLLIRNDAPAADREAVAKVLAKIEFVRVAEPAGLALVASGGQYKLVGTDGVAILSLGPPAAPDFAERLTNALQKIARVQMLLALRTSPDTAGTAFCVGNDLQANAYGCMPSDSSSGPRLAVNKQAKLIVINTANKPRHVYVYAIDENYAVNLALPDSGGKDPPLEQNRPLTGYGATDTKGRLTFLTIASDVPIKASVLEQSGVAARDPAACNASKLAQVLCAAQRGTRSAATPSNGEWTAIVTTATVK